MALNAGRYISVARKPSMLSPASQVIKRREVLMVNPDVTKFVA
jgi:hypothetical protein